MALVLANRVQESATANTTVSFTLTGAVAGYQSFAVVGNTNTTYYAATDSSNSWEVGLGTYSTTGPTLTRTTILASSNSGSAVTFVGTVTVFLTYPSSKSVNLDASGNVSALGTVASGTWQGTTVGVGYGGTGVTASSGANSVVLRDANSNITVNRLNQSSTSVAAAAGTTILTAASTYGQILTGTGGQTFRLPDATTLTNTTAFQFNNNATGTLTIQDNASATVGTVAPGGAAEIALLANGTVGGTWDVHAYIPESVTWGTNALALGGTVITGGTWNGGTIGTGYGGTGLTTFTSGGALYATSTSALSTGTLPVASGGTGVITSTGSGNNVLSTSPTLTTPILGTPTSGTLTNCTGYTYANLTGTVPTWNQNTTGSSASCTGNAATATNATYATSAGSATNATAAGSATNATFASSATNASAATNAGAATNATYATSAGSATNATYAASATNASAATNAGYATYANSAGYATYANSAGSAGSATTASYLTGPAYTNGSDGWFRTTGACGLYYASYGRGLRSSDGVASYGNNVIYGGGLNGWQGWAVTDGNNCILMSNGSNWGVYNPAAGQWMLISDMSGNATFQGNVTAYSDLRLKKNVREIDNVVERRDTLAKAAIKYERDGRTRVGYGAQTLRDGGCAEFVLEADDALKTTTGLGTLSVDYGETAAVLAVVSKMTDDRIAVLEARIAQLENTWFKRATNACRNFIARY